MLYQLTLEEAINGLKEKKFSSEELLEAFIERIEERNPLVNAVVHKNFEEARIMAKESDQRRVSGREFGDLDGIPMALKDIFNMKGVPATCCSKVLKGYKSPFDCTVVGKLRNEGVVFTGMLNMDEFACGSSNESSVYGVCKNPHDLERVPGGSSGGSAAAVYDGMTIASLGTDTGGSIRQPASLCGIVGLKVTYGRVSRSGVTAMASSWDTIGPMTKTVRDAAILMKYIAGHDGKDATTLRDAVPNYLIEIEGGIEGLRIGVPKEYFGDGIEPETEKKVMEAIRGLEKRGAILKEVSLPMTKYAVALYYVSMPAELSTNLSRFDGIRFGLKVENDGDIVEQYFKVRSQGFGDEIKRRILVGTYVLSAGYYDAYYRKAQKVRTLVIQDFERVFDEVDVVMGPVSPFPAWKLGELSEDPLAMYLADALTIPASAAGIPAISVPCGKSSAGLPIGVQVIGKKLAEGLVMKVGREVELLGGVNL